MLQPANIQGKYLIPIDWMIAVALLQTLGSVLAGTGFFFATCTFVILLLCGFTYNMLGGFGHPGGIFFAAFAMRTIVISQFAKVILFESAEANLEAPHDTILAYLCFYASAAVGIYLARFFNWRLPRPKEADLSKGFLPGFLISFLACVIIWFLGFQERVQFRGIVASDDPSFALFPFVVPLLFFCTILCVDHRIRISNGRQSTDLYFWIVAGFAIFVSCVDDIRSVAIGVLILYFVTCIARGFHFSAVHYFSFVMGVFFFVLWLSPFILYLRSDFEQKSMGDRLYYIASYFDPSNSPWDAKGKISEDSQNGENREAYYNNRNLIELSRLSLIRSDANMVSATNTGYHYGWTTFLIDAARSMPHFLFPNKPQFGWAEFAGRVTGMDKTVDSSADIVLSPIGDGYGAFGLLGVIIFPFFVMPFAYLVITNSFDMMQPWGTSFLMMLVVKAGEMGYASLTIGLLRLFLIVVIVSYLYHYLVSGIQMFFDRQ